MPFTASEISEAQKTTLDFYLKNNPIDQVAVDRPIMNALMAGKKEFPGGKQYVVEQLRYRYQSNMQWISGAQEVTYNRRQTVEQSQYQWRTAHDGYAIDEDRLAQNGITLLDSGKGGSATDAELIQLSNLLEEQNIALKSGFEEKFSVAEGEVARGLREVDFIDEFAVGAVDGDVVAGHPDVSFVIGSDAIWGAIDVCY